nr:GNAT family N-acetyltransferase [Opitutaceae bacterium]
MTALEIFQRYRDERRCQPIDGYTVDRFPHLSRYTAATAGAEGFVVYAELNAGEEAAQIEVEIDYFAAHSQRFEWKVYEFDHPANLRGLLERRGFKFEEPEAFMVLPVTAWSPRAGRDPAARVERVTDERGLRDVITLQEVLFAQDFGWLFDRYAAVLRTAPERVAMYCAYIDATAVGTGWIDFPDGSQFAELHGGAVLPQARGTGVFSALLDRRMIDAGQRGYEFVAVDAAPMSRPILERKGFQHVCWTHPMRLANAPQRNGE